MNLIKKIVRTIAGKPTDTENTSHDNKEKQSSESIAEDQKTARRNTKSSRPARESSSSGTPNRSRGRNSNSGSGPSAKKAHNHKSRGDNPQAGKPEKFERKTQSKPRQTSQPAESNKPISTRETVDPVGFKDFDLCPEIFKAIGEQGYESPTPIQQASISELISGRDLLGCAQTGTGKTASFALPTLELLHRSNEKKYKLRALVLTPTRELALQVAESFQSYGKHLPIRTTVVFGGVGLQPQKDALKRGIDILVATPGRLIDLYNQGFVDFSSLQILILDEADRMLDMGFLPDVKRILKMLPPKRQNILFSATMPKDINQLSMTLLKDPIKVKVAAISSTSEQVDQSIYFVNRPNKRNLILSILENPDTVKVLVFTRTKAIANRVTKLLVQNEITAEAIHGNKSQTARQRALDNFKNNKTRVLVASDLAARGLDVDDISHVINFDLPNIAETYVHRIGRTGRASAKGTAISFCDSEEREYLRTIEKIIGKKIPVVEEHAFLDGANDPVPAKDSSKQRNFSRGKPRTSSQGNRSPGNSSGSSSGNNSRRPSNRNSSKPNR